MSLFNETGHYTSCDDWKSNPSIQNWLLNTFKLWILYLLIKFFSHNFFFPVKHSLTLSGFWFFQLYQLSFSNGNHNSNLQGIFDVRTLQHVIVPFLFKTLRNDTMLTHNAWGFEQQMNRVAWQSCYCSQKKPVTKNKSHTLVIFYTTIILKFVFLIHDILWS